MAVREPATAPYGTWRSPVGADLVARATSRLRETRIEQGAVWWLEMRPAEQGRTALVRSDLVGGPRDVTPAELNVRTLVHEYGGGAYTVRGATAFFSNFEDQRLYRQELEAEPAAITPEPSSPRALRYADPDVSPDGRWIACVREDHTEPGLAVNAVVVLAADGSVEPRVIDATADFVAFPRFSPSGDRLAWIRWDFPRMPWDGTELVVAPFADGETGPAIVVAGGPSESIFQPAWSPAGGLHFVSDRTGWWNLHRLEPDGTATNLTPMAAEFGVPMWQFGYSSCAFLDDGRIACAYRRSGVHHLGILDAATSELIDVDVPYACLEPPYVRAEGTSICFVGSGPSTPEEVVVLDLSSRSVDVVRPAEEGGIDAELVSVAEPFEFETADGRTAFAYHYPPRNPAFAAPDGELPPLVVHAHGGPTSEARPDLSAAVQYFTTRGFAFVDVNYGGSTGYGREYRERLYGTWGVVDVDDCIAAGRHLAATGGADPARIVVTGGSAGGYVVLAAMAFRPEAFAAGASYFGVADVESLAATTHKFESRYLDLLLGSRPEWAERWRERSPIHRADAIRRPLLLLQGLEDAVVPPSQAETMIAALERNGVPYAYLAFEGEQHGFRRAENIARSLEAELAFYGGVLGFEPADELPALEIHHPSG